MTDPAPGADGATVEGAGGAGAGGTGTPPDGAGAATGGGPERAAGRAGRLTRRALLVGIGAAGGAGAMFAAMGALGLAPAERRTAPYVPPQRSDFALTGRASASVLVLGAGVAGLACAYELGKAGYECTVLEAADRVGGRSLTLRGGDRLPELNGETQEVTFGEGVYFNAGPARIAQWMVTMDYCRELGVPVEPFINSNANGYVHREGRALLRMRTARADMYGYIGELLAKAADQGALDRELTAADKERLLEFLTDFGDLVKVGRDLRYTGSERRGYQTDPGVEPGTLLGPVPSLSQVLSLGLGRALTVDASYAQAMPMFQTVGGMDALTNALAGAVGADRIRLGRRVTKITNLPDGVEVVTEGAGGAQTHRADYCVATLPPHLLARVESNLDAGVRTALSRAVPFSAGKIGLEYDRRWWELEDRIYGGSTETNLDIARIWYPSYGFHARRGLIVGYYNTGEDADRYAALSHRERRDRALAQGAKIHGEKYRTGVLGSASVAWRRQPYLEGAWVSWSDPEAPRALGEPAGRVYFAGDWLSQLNAWKAGALESARRTVTLLHRRVMSGS